MSIPAIFHSFLTDDPFVACSMCERPFTETTQYMIEKAYVRDEVIFEYALCDPCLDKIRSEVSVESLAAVARFFTRSMDRDARTALQRKWPTDPEDWIQHCILTGRARSDCDHYQICGVCRGTDMVFGEMPCMISSPALEELQQELSKKTKDRFDDFTRDVLGLPTDLADLPLVLV